MRTKALLLTAAIGAVGIAASNAQVFSVNAVGYVNLDLPAGFSMIANPLNGTNNNLSTILPDVPDGSSLLKWNATSQSFEDANVFIGGVGWVPDATLNPGEGAFINLPAAATLTFVGEVPQGDLSVSIPQNFSIVSQLVPQTNGLSTVDFPAADGDSVLFWDRAGQVYKDAIVYIGGVGWVPEDPSPAVGESFFVNKVAPATWTRTFTVN